ncbi:HD-GYP domain-containing protein [Halarcobacter ebronensis]|uniref:HD-GYP domain-containing protein n=1 Tax=Halarcobacter ebronensis TaxID=1462615 RepID=A0A4Q1AJ50_9BACT|nr:HD domain-containing phosphohydrolase [Halarcobacter ebronensis]QKF82104.1 c-di-GMP phosphodiesterase, class II (HD-GYP domain) [Halarcobacter ebronensis]RXK04067.1 hypothetical protein CRV07_11600 [Halarcobacter ebronensis]
MDKKREILFNINNFSFAFSKALDSIEMEYFFVSNGHSRRVAYVCLMLAKEFNYSKEGLSDICAYSLLHNIALKKTKSKNKQYCDFSQTYMQSFPFLLKDQGEVLKYQCEHFDGTGIFGLKESEIPLFSQFISFVDIIDTKFDLSKGDVQNREKILNFIKEGENRLFSSDVVECFVEFSQKESFWLDLQNEDEIAAYIFKSLSDVSIALEYEKLLEITSIFYNLVDEDGKLIENCSKLADLYNFDHKDKQTFLIAASLTNLGKFFISDSILNKNSSLDTHEYLKIKSYPYYTKKVLSDVLGFNDVTTWATRVQEFINGKGYPYALEGKDLSLKDRVMLISNIFTSLTSKKSYRDAYKKDEAFKILDDMAENSCIDKAIVEDIKEVFK